MVAASSRDPHRLRRFTSLRCIFAMRCMFQYGRKLLHERTISKPQYKVLMTKLSYAMIPDFDPEDYDRIINEGPIPIAPSRSLSLVLLRCAVSS